MALNIVLLGPPGSGKGTQAKSICQEFDLALISTGDLLREAVRAGTPLGKQAKGYMDAGKLVPDDLVIGLIKEKIKGIKGGFLLDGFPRNIEQAKMLDETAHINLAIDLDVNQEAIVDRIIKRRSCRKCNAVFHLDNKPSKVKDVCDVCGGELYQRTDDSESVVRERLKVYHERTFPLVKFYQAKGILIEVDGNGSIDEVHKRIVSAIRAHMKK